LLNGIICHGVSVARAGMNVESAHLGAVERACAAAAKDSELVSGFINRPVAVNAF
jgi:hypothetical protein